ncbi:MAG TPA: PQQ-dependent sugar dehydrogenase [Thermoanaerobaculia bacterium]|nr:PQQ-dependent sugar dehydrogenase [Thermoanaerobaculia bacterium]
MRFLVLLLLAVTARGETLPGFRVETVARFDGFVSSVVADSHGVLYATTTDGWIHRVDADGTVTRVASLPTHSGSNGGLLGMALLNDQTAIVHYTNWGGEDLILDDVVSRVDLATGAETVIKEFACDVEVHAHGASSEHHGGNPTVAPDGSIFLGIGEYGAYNVAQRPGWNGGRIWRIDSTGNATQWAQGLRNPYDLAWDPELNAIVSGDNGPDAGDEIHVIPEGGNCGWPQTFGNEPPVAGDVAPNYVFPDTVAPTGLLRLDGKNAMLRRGYLVGAFVTSSLYYFPSLTVKPVAAPVPVVNDFDQAIIDVTEGPAGDVYFATASFSQTSTIHRLIVPARGDCNGDALVDSRDLLALLRELDDGATHRVIEAQDGAFAGSWGCDANADGTIDGHDLDELRRLLGTKRRAVGRR